MTGIVQLALDHHAAGHGDAAQQVLDSISPGGRWQVELHFDQVAAICRHRIEARQESRPGNRLVVEHVAPLPRCVQQAPDGRGAAWLASGGSVLAYGMCCVAGCPLGRNAGKAQPDNPAKGAYG